MKIQNISNVGRMIYLFLREDNGNLNIIKDDSFYPFFYEPSPDGQYLGYDGEFLEKIIVNNPSEINQLKSPDSYGADIRYPINYLIHKVDKLSSSPIKYFFIDIEVLCTDLPDVKKAKDPVSCITCYNSLNKEYKTFFIGDYEGTIKQKEGYLLGAFLDYMKIEQPDLWLSWNVSFDYQYLHNRIKNFAKEISPINQARLSKEDDIYLPAGISILDYLELFKKVNLRENSYKLDSVAEKHLGFGKKHKSVDFSDISHTLKERNREDVELLVKLEEKFKIINYFNEIRLFSKCLWEDLTHNSMILDSVVLEEAKRRDVVLPNKMNKFEREEEESLQGAYRRSDSGVFFDVYKADVASMYPNQLVNFCLDSVNIVSAEEDHKDCIKIEDTWFKQDQNAILPYLAIKLMNIKDDLKAKLKKVALNTDEAKVLQMKYDAYKGLVNSLFGVTAFPSFRLYDNRVASAITFLARDLLHYTEDYMTGHGIKVVAVDTDALMYLAEKDEVELLNSLTQDWAKLYGKEFVNIRFESEGKFTKLLIVGKCHYFGYIETPKGIKKEIKGMEVKRSSSSKYESEFQETLIEKILNKESKDSIIKWLNQEKINIKTSPIEKVGFPCKLSNKEYKSVPIFVRAYMNTKNICPNFKMSIGENFYYIFVNSLGKDSNGKEINVLAFTLENNAFIDKKRIDWEEVIRRNIEMKSDTIFEAIGWKQKNKDLVENTLF